VRSWALSEVLIFSVLIFNFSNLMNLSYAFRPCGLVVRSDGFSFSGPMCTDRNRSPSDMLRKVMSVRATRKPALCFFMVYYGVEFTAGLWVNIFISRAFIALGHARFLFPGG
jgi:hypothetical protein